MRGTSQADGYAVKELTKVAQVLYSAMKSNPDEDDDILGVRRLKIWKPQTLNP